MRYKSIFFTAATLAGFIAGTALTTGIASAYSPVPTEKLATADQNLEAAYKSAWSTLDRAYANKDKLTGDWPAWKDRFAGQLHSEADLTVALTKLVVRVGDPQVQLLTPAQVAAMNARASGGHFGYGLQAKFLPILGPYARLEVEKEVNACAGDKCWQGEGQGHKDGLRSGDILYAVDHKSFAGMDSWELFDYVVAHNGPLTFSVKRGVELLDIVVHPQADRPMNFNLDISVQEVGDYEQAFVFADGQGPAILAGIGEKDVLESVNGKPAEQMSPTKLRLLRGECKPGESLRLKIRRLADEVTIPCGLVPSGDNLSGNAGGIMAGNAVPWQVSIRNLDDPKAASWTEDFLSDYTKPGAGDIVATIDLRGTTGNDDHAAEKIASLFVQNGTLGCLTAGWRSDKICDLVKGGSVVQEETRWTSPASAPFKGQVVVVIDDQTAGTALLLAAYLQENGAKVITSGAAVRQLPDLISKESIAGDPATRSIQYPGFHHTLGDGAVNFTADFVVPAGHEFSQVQKMFNLTFPPNDLHSND